MFQLFFIALALIAASIHLALSPKRRSSRSAIAETYLLYLFVFYVGVMGLFTSVFHVFFQARASASIGWAPSPFEYEVGIADLTVGVLGILCIWFRGNFWLATAIAESVLVLGRRHRTRAARWSRTITTPRTTPASSSTSSSSCRW